MSAFLTFTDVGVLRGDTLLFEGLTLEICSGDIVWVQGTNGVGKTTLLHLAAGLARQDYGEIVWYENARVSDAYSTIGFQGHKEALKPRMTAFEDLSHWAELADYKASLNDIFSKIGLSERKGVLCGKLSAGQRRRLSLGRLMVAKRQLWIMDEPAAVMDDAGNKLIDNLIRAHIEKGGAALIASHGSARKIGPTTRLLKLSVS